MYSNKTIAASYFLITAGIIILVIWLFLLLPSGGDYYKLQVFRICLPFIGTLSTATGWLILHTVREALDEVSLLRVEINKLSARLEQIESSKQQS